MRCHLCPACRASPSLAHGHGAGRFGLVFLDRCGMRRRDILLDGSSTRRSGTDDAGLQFGGIDRHGACGVKRAEVAGGQECVVRDVIDVCAELSVRPQ